MRALNLTGQRFGRLIALERAPSLKDRTYWKCLCDCGKTVVITTPSLTRGLTNSCGCIWAENITISNKKRRRPGNFTARRMVYAAYRTGAKRRDLDFDLTEDQCIYLFLQNCFYCNTPPSNNKGGRYGSESFTYQGIDRKDNNLGYFIDNCVPCCARCNRAKDIMSCNDFLSWVSSVYSNRARFYEV